MYNLNPFNPPPFHGIEVDMLSLGDADSILVTEWFGSYAFRVLIDGGTASDAKTVREFLRSRNATSLNAVVCTHPHDLKPQMINSQRLELRTAERYVAVCVVDFKKDAFRSPVNGS